MWLVNDRAIDLAWRQIELPSVWHLTSDTCIVQDLLDVDKFVLIVGSGGLGLHSRVDALNLQMLGQITVVHYFDRGWA